jgi:3-methyladenine DNA glycosylase/8-oxoguanine DNA glycosylase
MAAAPRPEDLLATSDEDLRRAGLSRGKTLAVKTRRQVRVGDRAEHGPSPAHAGWLVIERLTAVRGGPLTAKWF